MRPKGHELASPALLERSCALTLFLFFPSYLRGRQTPVFLFKIHLLVCPPTPALVLPPSPASLVFPGVSCVWNLSPLHCSSQGGMKAVPSDWELSLWVRLPGKCCFLGTATYLCVTLGNSLHFPLTKHLHFKNGDDGEA